MSLLTGWELESIFPDGVRGFFQAIRKGPESRNKPQGSKHLIMKYIPGSPLQFLIPRPQILQTKLDVAKHDFWNYPILVGSQSQDVESWFLIWQCLHLYLHTYTSTYPYICICTCLFIYLCMCICIYRSIYIYIYIHKYIYIHALYVYIYTSVYLRI